MIASGSPERAKLLKPCLHRNRQSTRQQPSRHPDASRGDKREDEVSRRQKRVAKGDSAHDTGGACQRRGHGRRHFPVDHRLGAGHPATRLISIRHLSNSRPCPAATIAALDPADGCPADAGRARDLVLRSSRVVAPCLDHRRPPLRRQPPIALGLLSRRQFDALSIRQPPDLGKAHTFVGRATREAWRSTSNRATIRASFSGGVGTPRGIPPS